MRTYSATTTIQASPETIWTILTDAPGYLTWEPNVTRIEGTIAAGEKVTIYSRLNPTRAFPLRVTEFVPSQRMTWTGGMPLGLFTGVRTFTLRPHGIGSTDFTLRETFSGPLLGLLGRSIPDLTPSFETFVAALKARAERAP
jgi:hypothetical protein